MPDVAKRGRLVAKHISANSTFSEGGTMNHHHPVTEAATLMRAAKHLIHNHGSQAAQVAAKRAVFLEQCNELVGADTWHKIGAFVHAIATNTEPPLMRRKPAEPAAPPPEPVANKTVMGLRQEWPLRREPPAAMDGTPAAVERGQDSPAASVPAPPQDRARPREMPAEAEGAPERQRERMAAAVPQEWLRPRKLQIEAAPFG
jgi:hypothetical protein